MNTKKSVIVACILAVLALVGTSLIKKAPLTVNSPVVETAIGALSSPDIPSPYISWGGVKTYNASKALATATTSVCSIQSPSSTSTLVFSSVQITTGTSTQSVWDIGTSTTAFSTTTKLLPTFTLLSGAQNSFTYQGTTSAAYNVMSPNTWINWMAGGYVVVDPTGVKVQGTCNAQFIVL